MGNARPRRHDRRYEDHSVILSTLAALCIAAPADILIIARDGANKLTAAETSALAQPTERNLNALVDEGYIVGEIEEGVTLAIDPTAPPLGPIVTERVLLQAFGDLKSARSFGDLDATSRRAIENTISAIYPDRAAAPNTQFMVRADARYNLKVPGGRATYTATYRLAGPSNDELRAVKSNPLRKLAPNEATRSKDPAQRHSAELVDNIMPWVSLEWRSEIYRKCQERIIKQLETELDSRKKAMLSAIRSLPNPPNATSGRDDVPPDELERMKRNFEGSWRALGYESREAASAAWASARWGSADVAFTLFFGDTLSDTGTEIGIAGIEFGRSGR